MAKRGVRAEATSEAVILLPGAVDSFAHALAKYANALTENFGSLTQAQPEDQLKGPVSSLVKAAAADLLLPDCVVRTEVRVDGVAGRPDLGVDLDGLLMGNIELKAPGKGARPEAFSSKRDREQWQRFSALPNLIYTDGESWALYRNGERVSEAKLSVDPTRAPKDADFTTDAETLLRLLAEFFHWAPTVPSTPAALAKLLAPLTRLLRDEVLVDVAAGGDMALLADEWRATLFPDADDATFADAYAQTLTYALLLARLEGASPPLSTTQAAQRLDSGHALLAQVLRVLGQDSAQEAIGMPARLLERVISAVDPEQLASRSRDPWLYFYEDFLAAYDSVQRNNRGVYYTPIPVVACQVRLAESVLRDKFKRTEAFADPEVVILDPAAGTSTYPLTIIARTLDRVGEYGPGVVAETATRLANNIYAFELLVGPYSVSHLRVSRALADAGATLPAEGVHVYLTDTLAAANDGTGLAHPSLFAKRLATEQARAARVKSSTRVWCVIGNPPWDRDTSSVADGRRKGGIVRYEHDGQLPLLADYIEPLPPKARAQQVLNLYNDYVYFWRWSAWKVAEQAANEPGMVSLITASSYLDGPAYAGMRQRLREQFDELWVIDLGGQGRGTLTEDNVFPGVLSPNAITIAVRYAEADAQGRASTPATTYYRRVSGTREAKYKELDNLDELNANDPGWVRASDEWQAPFIAVAGSMTQGWPLLGDILCWSGRGIQFSRSWPVSEDKDTCRERWDELVNAAGTGRQEQLLHGSCDTNVTRDYPSFLHPGMRLPRLDSLARDTPPDGIERIGFRSFDRQWAVADRRVIDRPRPPLWQVRSASQVYFTTTTPYSDGPVLVASTDVPDLNAFNNRGGIVYPLYRDAAATRSNITPGLAAHLTSQYGRAVDDDDIAAYLYGLLGTGAYAMRLSEVTGGQSLPVPFTADGTLFARVGELGRELLWWHTWGERFVPVEAEGSKSPTLPVGSAKNTVALAALPEDVTYDADSRVLKVGEGEFAPVTREQWEFSVSGMKVVQSWLGYRRAKRSGKTSSELDKLRPKHWTASRELVTLLGIVQRTLELTLPAEALLEQVLSGPLLSELPRPPESFLTAPSDGEELAAGQGTLGD